MLDVISKHYEIMWRSPSGVKQKVLLKWKRQVY
jgi:hypothetical protein